MRTLARIIAATVLVPWLVVSSTLAPEHVHEAGSADHHDSVAHRHFAPHEHGQLDAFHLDHDGAEIEDPDGHVVWLDPVGLAESTHTFPVVLFVVSMHLDSVLPPIVRAALTADEATLPHGPPRVSASLRAPPSCPAADLI